MSTADVAYTTFTPHTGRLLLVELRSLVFGIVAGGVVLVIWKGPDVSWPWAAYLLCMALLGFGVRQMRQSRRIVVADSWISGPAGRSDTTVMEFGIVDRRRSAMTGRRLKLQTASGRRIDANLSWYAPEDVEELRRLLRDRAGLVTPT